MSQYDDMKNIRAGVCFVLGIVGFFAFLAYSATHGANGDTLFQNVLEALAGAVTIPVILSAVWKKLATTWGIRGKKPGEIGKMFVGYQSPYATMSEIPSNPREWSRSRALVPAEETVPAPFQEDDQYGDDQGEEAQSDPWTAQAWEDACTEDEWDEVIEEGGLRLADNFLPGPEGMNGQRIALIGVPGSGKGNAGAVLCEELAQWDERISLIIFDTEGEYEALADKHFLPRGVLVGPEELRDEAPQGIRFVAIDKKGAFNFGSSIIEHSLHAVINLSAWEDNDAGQIMSAIVLGVQAYQQTRPTELRKSTFFYLPEATKWFPQNTRTALKADVQAMIQNAFFDVIVRRGRKRAIGFIADLQSVAETDKRLFKGQWKLLFCTTEKSELEAIKKVYGIEPEEMKALQPGECFIFCPQRPSGIYMRFRMSQAELGGKTPSLENVKRAHVRPVTEVIGRLMTPQPAPPSLQKGGVAQHPPLRYPLHQAETRNDDNQQVDEPITRPPVHETEPLEAVDEQEAGGVPALEQYVAAWFDGHTGVRECERYFGISYHASYQLYKKALAKHLIRPKKARAT